MNLTIILKNFILKNLIIKFKRSFIVKFMNLLKNNPIFLLN